MTVIPAMTEQDVQVEPGDFETDGYLVVRHAVSDETIQLVHRYALSHMKVDGYFLRDGQSHTPSRYADALGEALLEALLPNFETLIGKALLPTYSFLRVYLPGTSLTPHIDREECEISATLAVGYNTSDLWPIYIETHGKPKPVHLAAGDLMLYQGTRIPHWREPLEAGYWVQIFLHYVTAAGPYCDERFDGRESTGPWYGFFPRARGGGVKQTL